MAFVRDPITKAVINTDDSQYRSILAMRESQKEAERSQRELHALKGELTEIKALLQQVLNGKK